MVRSCRILQEKLMGWKPGAHVFSDVNLFAMATRNEEELWASKSAHGELPVELLFTTMDGSLSLWCKPSDANVRKNSFVPDKDTAAGWLPGSVVWLYEHNKQTASDTDDGGEDSVSLVSEHEVSTSISTSSSSSSTSDISDDTDSFQPSGNHRHGNADSLADDNESESNFSFGPYWPWPEADQAPADCVCAVVGRHQNCNTSEAIVGVFRLLVPAISKASLTKAAAESASGLASRLAKVLPGSEPRTCLFAEQGDQGNILMYNVSFPSELEECSKRRIMFHDGVLAAWVRHPTIPFHFVCVGSHHVSVWDDRQPDPLIVFDHDCKLQFPKVLSVHQVPCTSSPSWSTSTSGSADGDASTHSCRASGCGRTLIFSSDPGGRRLCVYQYQPPGSVSQQHETDNLLSVLVHQTVNSAVGSRSKGNAAAWVASDSLIGENSSSSSSSSSGNTRNQSIWQQRATGPATKTIPHVPTAAGAASDGVSQPSFDRARRPGRRFYQRTSSVVPFSRVLKLPTFFQSMTVANSWSLFQDDASVRLREQRFCIDSPFTGLRLKGLAVCQPTLVCAQDQSSLSLLQLDDHGGVWNLFLTTNNKQAAENLQPKNESSSLLFPYLNRFSKELILKRQYDHLKAELEDGGGKRSFTSCVSVPIPRDLVNGWTNDGTKFYTLTKFDRWLAATIEDQWHDWINVELAIHLVKSGPVSLAECLRFVTSRLDSPEKRERRTRLAQSTLFRYTKRRCKVCVNCMRKPCGQCAFCVLSDSNAVKQFRLKQSRYNNTLFVLCPDGLARKVSLFRKPCVHCWCFRVHGVRVNEKAERYMTACLESPGYSGSDSESESDGGGDNDNDIGVAAATSPNVSSSSSNRSDNRLDPTPAAVLMDLIDEESRLQNELIVVNEDDRVKRCCQALVQGCGQESVHLPAAVRQLAQQRRRSTADDFTDIGFRLMFECHSVAVRDNDATDAFAGAGAGPTDFLLARQRGQNEKTDWPWLQPYLNAVSVVVSVLPPVDQFSVARLQNQSPPRPDTDAADMAVVIPTVDLPVLKRHRGLNQRPPDSLRLLETGHRRVLFGTLPGTVSASAAATTTTAGSLSSSQQQQQDGDAEESSVFRTPERKRKLAATKQHQDRKTAVLDLLGQYWDKKRNKLARDQGIAELSGGFQIPADSPIITRTRIRDRAAPSTQDAVRTYSQNFFGSQQQSQPQSQSSSQSQPLQDLATSQRRLSFE